MFALQHRGQESGGIALTDGQDIHTFRGMGLISTVFANGVPEEEGGPVGIGHVRYSTTGSNNPAISSPWPYTRLWDSWHWLITAT